MIVACRFSRVSSTKKVIEFGIKAKHHVVSSSHRGGDLWTRLKY
jgi:hypothetical protein